MPGTFSSFTSGWVDGFPEVLLEVALDSGAHLGGSGLGWGRDSGPVGTGPEDGDTEEAEGRSLHGGHLTGPPSKPARVSAVLPASRVGGTKPEWSGYARATVYLLECGRTRCEHGPNP